MKGGFVLLPRIKSLVLNLSLAHVTDSHFLSVAWDILLPFTTVPTHQSTINWSYSPHLRQWCLQLNKENLD